MSRPGLQADSQQRIESTVKRPITRTDVASGRADAGSSLSARPAVNSSQGAKSCLEGSEATAEDMIRALFPGPTSTGAMPATPTAVTNAFDYDYSPSPPGSCSPPKISVHDAAKLLMFLKSSGENGRFQTRAAEVGPASNIQTGVHDAETDDQ